MKSYPLEMSFLYNEAVEDPTVVYSKGHHAFDEFKERAMLELEAYPHKINKLQERMPLHYYAKTVGYFEGGRRIGYTLKLSETPRKGYFPVRLLRLYDVHSKEKVKGRCSMIVCECCGRQIVPGHGTPDNYITYGPVTRLVGNQYMCAICTADLDEDALFPEERVHHV